jgi:hypothetical protein
MPVPDDFLHQHRDALKSIQLNAYENKAELERAPNDPLHTAQRMLVHEYEKMVTKIAEDLKRASPEPEMVLEHSTRGLHRVDRCRHLLENLLEAVKRGESLNNTLDEFGRLDLAEKASASSPLGIEKATSPFLWNLGAGRFLRRMLRRLKKLALTLIELVVNAVRAIPRFVSIHPKPSLGFAGAFPTLSFEFDLEAEPITIHELFHALEGTLDED